jgi:hypothetical protein
LAGGLKCRSTPKLAGGQLDFECDTAINLDPFGLVQSQYQIVLVATGRDRQRSVTCGRYSVVAVDYENKATTTKPSKMSQDELDHCNLIQPVIGWISLSELSKMMLMCYSFRLSCTSQALLETPQ